MRGARTMPSSAYETQSRDDHSLHLRMHDWRNCLVAFPDFTICQFRNGSQENAGALSVNTLASTSVLRAQEQLAPLFPWPKICPNQFWSWVNYVDFLVAAASDRLDYRSPS